MATFDLSNECIKVAVLNTGATLHQLFVRDPKGRFVNVIVGLEHESDYCKDLWYRGAIVGRYAGRLSSPISIGEKKYPLKGTRDNIVLHSGVDGWHNKIWKICKNSENTLSCTYTCSANEVGFPGVVNAQICYRLLENGLEISYQATTDTPTPINLTNHAYFNMDGNGAMALHQLQLNASHYLDLDSKLVPTGRQIETRNTPYDFLQMRPIGNQFLDDFFVGTDPKIARLRGHQSKIEMLVETDQPGAVVFRPPHFEALCIETQTPRYDRSPNQKILTNTIPEQPYSQTTRFIFTHL